MAKKLRLKKKYRKLLHYAKGCTQASLVAIMLSNIIPANSTLMTVKAETNTKETIKLLARLQNTNLNDAQTLKKYIIDNYSIENNDTTATTDNTKVIMKSPAVVTEPTIDNSEFVVIPTETTENVETTVSFTPTEDAKKDEVEKKDEEIIETETNKETSQVVDDTNEKTSSATTSSIQETEQSTEIKDEPKLVDNEEILDLDAKEIVNTAPPEKSEETTIDSNTETTDYSNNFVTKSESGLELVLKSEHIEINDASEFKATDYVIATYSPTNALPVMTYEGNVNSYVDGDYKVTYKLVDTTGETITAELTVTIKTPEDMVEQQKAKTKKAVEEYANTLIGKSYDIDGYYGDQCWDLWAKYCEDNDLDFDYGTKPYGYAYGVSLKYEKSGAKKYFTAVSADEIECGDWLFWDKGSSCEASHVALLVEKYDDGTGLCLSQSYGNGTRLVKLQLDVMDVNFRPKGNIAWYK